jgi:hypothetical protein
MQKRTALLTMAALLIGCTAGTASAGLLWGLDTLDDQLFTLDTTTGTVTNIGTLPAFQFGGLDFDDQGNLYAILNSTLYLIDPNDASAVTIGLVSGVTFESFEIIDGVGYAADVYGEMTYTIDLADASITALGSHDTDGNDNRITGLASDGTSLWGVRVFDADVVALSLLDGSVTHVVTTSAPADMTSLAYGGGLLWTAPAFGDDLYTINPADGTISVAMSGLQGLGLGHVTGLTTPEPASLSLLALGSLALLRRRS